MVRDYLLLFFFLAYTVSLGISNHRPRKPPKPPKRPFTIRCLRGLAEILVILLLFFLFDRKAYIKLDFDRIGRGILSTKDNLSLLIEVSALPLIYLLVPKFRKWIYAVKNDGRQYGFPVDRMPTRYSELAIFVLFMLTAVVYEELMFRQVAFYAFYTVCGLRGDLLLIITSALFTFVHDYKKISYNLSVFLTGLAFGKAYQISGTIAWPMAMHFIINAPLLVIAFNRIRSLQRPASPPAPLDPK